MAGIIETPLTNNWREIQRYLQQQAGGINNISQAINVGPMRELIPQIGPIRRTDGYTADAAWAQANLAICVPFLVSADFWDVNALYWSHSAVDAGERECIAIYSEAGNRLLTTGSIVPVAQQAVTISPVVRLTRNRYWLSMSSNTAGVTMYHGYAGTPYGNDIERIVPSGVKHSTTAFPAAATITFTTPTTSFVPAVYVGIAAPT